MGMTNFIQHRATIMVTWVLAYLFLFQPCIPALAQMQDDCTAKLKEAEQLFYNGDFDKSVAIIKDCLSKSDFPVAKEKDAYELLAQNYLAKSYVSEARTAIKKLLTLVPNYVPPSDAPDLVSEVAKVKKELSEEEKPAPPPVAQTPPPAEESTFPKTWHWIAGGAVVTGVVLALVLKGSKSESTTPAAEPLPGPPAIP